MNDYAQTDVMSFQEFRTWLKSRSADDGVVYDEDNVFHQYCRYHAQQTRERPQMNAMATADPRLSVNTLMAAIKHYFWTEPGKPISLLDFKGEYLKLSDTDKEDLKAGLMKEGYVNIGKEKDKQTSLSTTAGVPMLPANIPVHVIQIEKPTDPLVTEIKPDEGYHVGEEHPAVKVA